MVTSGRVEREWIVRGVERAVERREVRIREVESIVIVWMEEVCCVVGSWGEGCIGDERMGDLEDGVFSTFYTCRSMLIAAK
jgi:hypothetical protein